MKNTERYRHLRVDWVGQSITLCGVEGEDIGAGQALCPDCAVHEGKGGMQISQ